MHDCPHPHCDFQIPWALFACGVHWGQLTPELQTAAVDARRHFVQGLDEDRLEQHDVLRDARAHWAGVE